jgi:integrase
MPLNVLTDVAIKTAKAHSAKKLFDGGGLYLLVKPNGARLWRLKYRHGGVEKLLALGAYPEVTLKRAREKRDEARQLLDRQIDPSTQRKAQKQAATLAKDNTLTTVAEEWFAHYVDERAKSNKPLSEKTIEKLRWLLNLPAYRAKKNRGPHPLRLLSDRSIQSITRDEIADVINGLKRRNKIETAHRMLNALHRVFRYAVGTGRMQRNPVAAFADSPDPRDRLPPVNHEHHPGLTDPRDVGGLLRATDGYVGEVTTGVALRLSPYVFVRPIEMRKAQWQDIDLDAKEPTWRIPSRTTKQRLPHIVPLAPQAVAILKELYQLTGPSGLVFPQTKDPSRPISENSVTSALRRMGYSGEQHTWHGYRTTASTLLREIGWESELVERQLAHEIGTDTGQAYDRSTRLPQRSKMMRAWADYLDGLKAGGNAIRIKSAKR